jgi:hypothetical protein
VIQTGDFNPDGSVHGFVPKGEKEERKVPLEISVKVCMEYELPHAYIHTTTRTCSE